MYEFIRGLLSKRKFDQNFTAFPSAIFATLEGSIGELLKNMLFLSNQTVRKVNRKMVHHGKFNLLVVVFFALDVSQVLRFSLKKLFGV